MRLAVIAVSCDVSYAVSCAFNYAVSCDVSYAVSCAFNYAVSCAFIVDNIFGPISVVEFTVVFL